MYSNYFSGVGVILIIAVLIGLIIGLVIQFFYLNTIKSALMQCSESNREIPPNNVFLMFIPIFSIIYGFILYPKVSDTLKKEFEARNNPQTGDYLKGLGIAQPILSICAIIPFIGGIASLGAIVVWIIYWVKIAGVSTLLKSMPKSNSMGMSGSMETLD